MPATTHHDTRDLPTPVRVRRIGAGAVLTDADRLPDRREPIDDGFLWVDLIDPDDAMLGDLAEHCRMHPLARRGLTERHRQSAVELYDGSAHVVLRVPVLEGDDLLGGVVQAVIARDALVTVRDAGALVCTDMDRVVERWRMLPADWRGSPGSLLYALCTEGLAAFMPIADGVEDDLERLENGMLRQGATSDPGRDDLDRLFRLTEHIADLHTVAVPFTDVLHTLIERSDWLDEPCAEAWTRSLHDDARRMTSRLQNLRDTAGRLFDMLDALATMKRNDISQQLANVATIFLPLSFLGAVFGQNFAWMEERIADGLTFFIWGVAVPVVALAVILGIMWRVGAFR